MRNPWGALLIPPLLVSGGLLCVSLYAFLRLSLYADLDLGQVGDQASVGNYVRVATDEFYYQSLWVTVKIAMAVVALSLLLAYPAAYILARMQSRWAPVLLAGVVITSFITIVIKVLGLIIIFGADAPLNKAMQSLGLLAGPMRLIGTEIGVVIGLTQYTLGFLILLLFGVISTIPRSLEDAAAIHGASLPRIIWRVVLPLSLPGIVAGGLVVFNMSMGAFTSAALLGGGRVLTLPVLIQRTIMLETRYALGAALSAILLLAVLAINILSLVAVKRLRAARLGVG
jgi:putative spermidine/putrescine transport system permease protein